MSTETLSTNMAGRPLRDGSKWGLEGPAVYSISKIGMWLFLATEIMLFAMLFTGYAIYYYRNPDAFHESAKALNTTFGAVNTVILLLSSFTVAWAIEAIKKNQRELCNVLLIITITLGVVFLVNKYFRWIWKTLWRSDEDAKKVKQRLDESIGVKEDKEKRIAKVLEGICLKNNASYNLFLRFYYLYEKRMI